MSPADNAYLSSLEEENRRLRDKNISLMVEREKAYAALNAVANHHAGFSDSDRLMREIARAALREGAKP